MHSQLPTSHPASPFLKICSMAVYAMLLLILMSSHAYCQDLLSLIEDDEEEQTEIVTAAWKANRVVNLHSIENTPAGVFDFKIGHRFGQISLGISELFGLDQSSVRIGGDYGITDRLMIGLGRSSFEKTIDGFVKYRLIRQTRGAKETPLSVSLFASTAIKTVPFQNPDRENFFSSRLYYTYQVILARKFSNEFTLQLSPTLVHRNLVEFTEEANDVYALAAAARFKLTQRLALNVEYIYVPEGQLLPGFRNSFTLGLDIETGGHVFQLHFTNSTSMIEKGFVAETTGNWWDGNIHFGFNVSRVFQLHTPKS